jgi:hypothetical protein
MSDKMLTNEEMIAAHPWYELYPPTEREFEAAYVIDAIKKAQLSAGLYVTRAGGKTISDIVGMVLAAEAITTNAKAVKVQVQWLEFPDGNPVQKLAELGMIDFHFAGTLCSEGMALTITSIDAFPRAP